MTDTDEEIASLKARLDALPTDQDAEIHWLTTDNNRLRARVTELAVQREYDNEQMDRYEARIAELEEALELIGDLNCDPNDKPLNNTGKIARTVLERKP